MFNKFIEMQDPIIKFESVSDLHQAIGIEKPKHPLISVIDSSDLKTTPEMVGQRFSSGLYTISMKDGHCGMQYGRGHYDFDEGVLIFMSPNQVITMTEESDPNWEGWMLVFHPDLIRKYTLGAEIDNYSFFSYEVNEALHLSEEERVVLYDCIRNIKEEYDQRIDDYSQKVMVSNIELLLSYCTRFYNRQFNTRSPQNSDIVTQVENHLKQYFESGQLSEYGVPSVQYFAEKVHLSANYLSDVLKKETGRSAKDHINDFLIKKAKLMLVNSGDSVSEIAYALGFNYPHYFSRLFKTKTGLTPNKYRELN